MSRVPVFDIETNGYLDQVTTIHCIVCCDINDRVIQAYHDTSLYPRHGSIADGLKYLAESDCIVGHNILGYDIPAIEKLHTEVDIRDPFVIDTQKLAEILHPEVKKQSIENWISILNLPDPKIKINAWEELTQPILDRCIGDVKNNVALYDYLISRKKQEELGGNSFNSAIKLEQAVAEIHADQELHGVWYDVDLALATAQEFKEEMDRIQLMVQDLAPPVLSIPGFAKEKTVVLRRECLFEEFEDYLSGTDPFKKSKFDKTKPVNPFSSTGKLLASVKSYFGNRDPNVRGPFSKVTFEIEDIYTANAISYFGRDYIRNVKGSYNKIEINPINCSSDEQVKDYLLSIGWVPIEYNYSKTTKQRTSPKLTEESYASLPPGLGQDIATYRILQHRRGLITNDKDPENKGALSRVRSDHRVPAEAFTCGTPTARYRHSGAVN